MIDTFLAFAKENNLIKKNDRLLVGVSGGIDSSVLLYILNQLKASLHLDLAIAHVNYGLREESDSDQKFVEGLANKYSIPLFVHRIKLSGSNVEQQAREIRYNFFNEILEQKGYRKIAVAHQRNDLAESLLLNIIRGTGIHGLAPMKVKSENIIRPMLYATRKEIEEYATENMIDFVTDNTNSDTKYSRNKVRHDVMPSMLDLNPNFLETAWRETQTFQQLSFFLKEESKKFLDKNCKKKDGGIYVDLITFAKLEEFMKNEVLFKAIETFSGNKKDISSVNISALLKLAEENNGTKRISLPRGLFAERIYDKMFIGPEKKNSQSKAKKAVLLKEGENNFDNFSFTLRKTKKLNFRKDANLVHIDISKTGPLLVRYKEDGDRMSISKDKTKKLQDIFVDKKIPQKIRSNIPLVVTKKNEIVWIPIIRVSGKFLPNKNSEQIISIKYKEKA